MGVDLGMERIAMRGIATLDCNGIAAECRDPFRFGYR